MNATAAIVPGPDDLHAGFRFYGTKSRCACKGGMRILQVLETDCNPTALQLVGLRRFLLTAFSKLSR